MPAAWRALPPLPAGHLLGWQWVVVGQWVGVQGCSELHSGIGWRLTLWTSGLMADWLPAPALHQCAHEQRLQA